MVAAIQAFLTKYNITTHSMALALVSLIAAYAAVPSFKELVTTVYTAMPGWLEQLVLAAVALFTWYYNGQTPVAMASTPSVAAVANTPEVREAVSQQKAAGKS